MKACNGWKLLENTSLLYVNGRPADVTVDLLRCRPANAAVDLLRRFRRYSPLNASPSLLSIEALNGFVLSIEEAALSSLNKRNEILNENR